MKQELFKQMLKEKGLKVTAQRMLMLEIMAGHPGEHLTAEEIFDLARQSYPEIGLATIYRALQVMVELHIIDKLMDLPDMSWDRKWEVRDTTIIMLSVWNVKPYFP